MKEVVKKKDDEINDLNNKLATEHIKISTQSEKINQLEKKVDEFKVKLVRDVETAVDEQMKTDMICASKAIAKARKDMYEEAKAAGFIFPKWDLDLVKWENDLNDEEDLEDDEEVDQLVEEMDQAIGNIEAQVGERVEATAVESGGEGDGVPGSNDGQTQVHPFN